ncbi:MAG TPA: hypothetical protein VK468_03070, partial [Pyrinomonadaceae bacterium]|nr:hypothetical protein [Pyrinomonadaceae bacterium]
MNAEKTGFVEDLLLREYGAVFAATSVKPPTAIVFEDEEAVAEFQSSVSARTAMIGEYEFTLQTAAMNSLLDAVTEAAGAGLTISGRGPDSALRSYAETVGLWASRVEPALDHWTREGRISPEEADVIRRLAPFGQVSKVLELENNGLFFAKDLSKSIIYSVAPPGSSQHLAMLAFDVAEFVDLKVREILARNYWYQTVVSDLPHFTFLGVA